MKIVKKSLALFLVLVTFALLFSVSASALTIYSGNFGYELNATTKEASIVRYIGTEEEPEIPSDVYGYKVTKINSSVFSDNNVIKKAVIPDSVQTIGDYTFSNCESLEEVVIPSSVNNLGKGIFTGCTALRKAEVNASVSVLPLSTFYNCTALSDITLSETISEYGDYAFYNCTSLESILIPETVTSISDTAFSGDNDIKFLCYKDSYAHSFAVSRGIEYVLIRMGDVNLDGEIAINDATDIQLHIAQIVALSDLGVSLADMNGDGTLSVVDVTALQCFLVDLG